MKANVSDGNRQRMESLCAYIRANCIDGEPLTLEKLSQQADLSPFHLQRTFKAVVGSTPREYVEMCRMEVLKSELRNGKPVTDAIYQAGFGGSSRVYEKVDTRLGMTPREYRQRGKNVAISYASVNSPLGLLMIGATDRGLCFVQFGETEAGLLEKLHGEYPAASIRQMREPYSPEFEKWTSELLRYLRREQTQLNVPVDVKASAFQMKVWRYLQSIPSGEVKSYAEVAAAIGSPRAVRAVGSACASNRVAIAIPCHRVIRGDGGLGGYRWGLERKRVLIDEERKMRSANAVSKG
ncbi:MAG: methylated-DNA--[protein]-cysteine S-methyltransferase [Acidobacteriaceae bacterium]|nr:methylated-DNA--[protein]-cysteine S-methyltransferase [Acidobacteriaceae bacterium]